VPPEHPPVEFRISHAFDDAYEGLGSLRYRAGFEDWDAPSAFVVQLEEATGYDGGRAAVDWHPVARFDHGRPHDVLDPAEGLHLDLYRRGVPDEYETVDLGRPRPRDLGGLFFRLQSVFEDDHNRALLVSYYRDEIERFDPRRLSL